MFLALSLSFLVRSLVLRSSLSLFTHDSNFWVSSFSSVFHLACDSDMTNSCYKLYFSSSSCSYFSGSIDILILVSSSSSASFLACSIDIDLVLNSDSHGDQRSHDLSHLWVIEASSLRSSISFSSHSTHSSLSQSSSCSHLIWSKLVFWIWFWTSS